MRIAAICRAHRQTEGSCDTTERTTLAGNDDLSIYATGDCRNNLFIPLETFLPGTELFGFYTSALSPTLGRFDRNFMLWAPQVTTSAASVKTTPWAWCSGYAHPAKTVCDPAHVTFTTTSTPSYGTAGPVTVRIGPSGAFIGMFCGNFSRTSTTAPGPVPRITGTKYEDVNGNGRRDAGEPGVGGFTIRLSRSGTQVATTTTASDGSYAFSLDANSNSAILPGTYHLSEDPKAGWEQSQAPADVTVDIAQGGIASDNGTTVTVTDRVFGGKDFGNYRPASITGSKVEDMDADGSPEGDPGLPGWTITASRGGSVAGSSVTAADGTYRIDGLRPGTYTVAEAAQAGWTESFPASGTYTVTLASGQTSSGRTFANWRPGSVTGRKFDDHAVDGSGDGDPGLAGWHISATGTGPGAAADTGTDGTYSLEGLRPGDYVVAETAQDDWRQTSPESGTHSVHVRSGQTVAAVDFGNVCLGGVAVTVTDIADGSSISGLTVRVDEVDVPGILANDPALPREVTSGWFGSLLPGTYRLTVFLPDDVFTTDPDVRIVDGRWAIVKTVSVDECTTAEVPVEVFRSSRGFVTGGMKELFAPGKFATSGFVFDARDGTPEGNLEFNDHEVPFQLSTSAITGMWVSDDLTNAWIWGMGDYEGQVVRFRLHVVDAGEPGVLDRYEFALLDRYVLGGADQTIIGGNVQIHRS